MPSEKVRDDLAQIVKRVTIANAPRLDPFAADPPTPKHYAIADAILASDWLTDVKREAAAKARQQALIDARRAIVSDMHTECANDEQAEGACVALESVDVLLDELKGSTELAETEEAADA